MASSSSQAHAQFSALSVESGLGKLEKLPPEGFTVYMENVPVSACTTGNPITSSGKVLLGVPRKQPANDSNLENDAVHHIPHGADLAETNGLENGLLVGDGDEESSPSSSSSSDSEGSGEEKSSEEGEEEVSDEVVLKQAGVELDLTTLGMPGEGGGVAPLQLLSEFVSCCVRDEYRAALILCNKVLEFEPNNATAQEFLPMLQERLKLDEELSTESSSDESTSSDSSHDAQPISQTISQSHDQC